jgi:hypothetical protein
MKHNIGASVGITITINDEASELLQVIKESPQHYQESRQNMSIILDWLRALSRRRQKGVESIQDLTKNFKT